MTSSAPPSYFDSVAAIPPDRRRWSRPWAKYRPVDITPPELQPAGLPASVAEGWAEPYVDPREVPDWSARQAAAVIPFALDDAGRPLHPEGRTGRSGRNLGRWGENPAADPIIVSQGQVLLIRRSDTGEWAIPGGMVDPGETAAEALVREAGEETGLDLTGYPCTVLARALVQDWRTTDHAWVATTAALIQLDHVLDPTAGDDATAARWWPFVSLDGLADALRTAGAELCAGHWPLLAAALITEEKGLQP